MTPAFRSAAATALALGTLYAATAVAGLLLLCLAFEAGLLASIEILFYRGLVLIALVTVALYGLLAAGLWRWRLPRIGARDAVAASAVSLALNVAFLVLVPVTVDRSISLFVLARMADHPQAPVTAEAMSAVFTHVYVDERRQIARRLREQDLSGNVAKDGDGYRITARGAALIAVARLVARLFDSHAGLVSAEPPSVATAEAPRATPR